MTHEQAFAVRAVLVAKRFDEDAIQSAFVGILEAEAKEQVIRHYEAFAVTLAKRRRVDAQRRVAKLSALLPEHASGGYGGVQEPEQLRRAEARQELARLFKQGAGRGK